ncbi:MAG TPA: hypothetical protein ENF73_03075 [Proteobacteria bacterium]|nr:hypothetical protein [Pseudomonadota bacterium]
MSVEKLKLVISDFHIGKGRYLPDGRKNYLEDFYQDEKFAEFLEYYSSNEYRNADVELIINGDFFDLLQVDIMGHVTDRITERISLEKLDAIRRGHPLVFESLRAFCEKPNKSIAYIIGNHDAPMLWSGCQRMFRELVGSSVRFFPESYSFDGVFVTHGHLYEFLNHFNTKQFWRRDEETGEDVLRLPWGSYFVIQVVHEGKRQRPYVDKVWPYRKFLQWMFFNDFWFFWKALFKPLSFWIRNRFSSDPYRRREFRLSPARLFDAMTHKSVRKVVEEILIRTSYHTVIIGHTHTYGYRNLAPHGEIFNTGTWMETIYLSLERFGKSLNRTYVEITYPLGPDKPPRSVLKKWHGQYHPFEEVAG